MASCLQCGFHALDEQTLLQSLSISAYPDYIATKISKGYIIKTLIEDLPHPSMLL
jgi:hypothetical protein